MVVPKEVEKITNVLPDNQLSEWEMIN